MFEMFDPASKAERAVQLKTRLQDFSPYPPDENVASFAWHAGSAKTSPIVLSRYPAHCSVRQACRQAGQALTLGQTAATFAMFLVLRSESVSPWLHLVMSWERLRQTQVLNEEQDHDLPAGYRARMKIRGPGVDPPAEAAR
eukprot:762583-Hanusia_phi.AAC.6